MYTGAPLKSFFPFFFFIPLCSSINLSLLIYLSVAIGNRGGSSGGLSGCAVEGAGEAAAEAGRRRLSASSPPQVPGETGSLLRRLHALPRPAEMATEADNELRQRVTEPREKPEQVLLPLESCGTCVVRARTYVVRASVRLGGLSGGGRLFDVCTAN